VPDDEVERVSAALGVQQASKGDQNRDDDLMGDEMWKRAVEDIRHRAVAAI
jgi:hypothetical protein